MWYPTMRQIKKNGYMSNAIFTKQKMHPLRSPVTCRDMWVSSTEV
jgi:hypothetical protein